MKGKKTSVTKVNTEKNSNKNTINNKLKDATAIGMFK